MTVDDWDALERLFEEGLQHPPEQRAAWLKGVCPDDIARQQELLEMWAANEKAGSFLGAPSSASLPAEPTLQPGCHLGRYEILDQLGAGGMGEVYRAQDTVLCRQVAIKVLPLRWSQDAGASARFQAEARAVAALSHRHILAIHDFGVENDIRFAVTELLEGKTLRERLACAPLPWREAIELAQAVASALHVAHEKGIVHRDIKPENLFLTTTGDIKILDYGLAQFGLDAESEAAVPAGLVTGTLGYLSPEQARGEAAGPASDLFSLGCVLYEMLSGSTPFARDTARQTLTALAREQSPALKGVPPTVSNLIASCLQKSAAHRPASAADLVLAFSEILRNDGRSLKSKLPAMAAIVGREQELDELEHLLANHRLVTLIGAGGCGKTRLAVEMGWRTQTDYPQGVVFADLTAYSNGIDVPVAVATALQLEIELGDPTKQISDYLAKNRLLLILDNCEHLIDAVANLTESILVNPGESRLLTTSRERIGHPTEQLLPVLPLMADSADAPAITLFQIRSRQLGIKLDSGDTATIIEICQMLDGLPLAIELAAARVTALSPSQILARLDDRFQLLSASQRSRVRTLEQTVNWSYDLLAPEEQRVFRHLGVFAGAFDADAAAVICGIEPDDALRNLQSLVEKSLLVVERNRDELRYRLLETLRVYATGRLQELGEVTRARDAHMIHFADDWSMPGMIEVEMHRGYELTRDFSDLAAAFDWATRQNDWSTAANLAISACGSSIGLNLFSATAKDWALQVSSQIDDTNPAWPMLICASGFDSLWLGDIPGVIEEFSKLIHAPDMHARQMGRCWVSHILIRGRQEERGLPMWESVLALENEIGPTRVLPVIEHFRGFLAIHQGGDFMAARQAYQRGVDYKSGKDFPVWQCHCTLGLAAMSALTGDPDIALQILSSHDWSLATALSVDAVRAAALFESGNINAGRKVALEFVRRIALGQQVRQANDALIVLAMLGLHDYPERVEELLLAAAYPRHAHALALSLHVAAKAGCRQRIESVIFDPHEARQQKDARQFLVQSIEELKLA